MKGSPLRALVAVALAGAAALVAVKVRGRRRELGPGFADPPDTTYAEDHMGETATAEGMPD